MSSDIVVKEKIIIFKKRKIDFKINISLFFKNLATIVI